MKKILPILLALIIISSFTSELNAQWGKKKNKTPVEYPENFDKELFELRYEEVVELEKNISKEDLFKKLEAFVIYNYKSPEDVIQKNDEENAVIITKGLLPYSYRTLGLPILVDNNAIHILDLRAKDNKYKITISGIGYKSYDTTTGLIENYYKSMKGSKINKWLAHSMKAEDIAYKELILQITTFVLEDINIRSNNDDW
ncbi:DUF4468 domain-containing protein [Candidatus Marinimicrobia bacterium]|nr:DUF4468 domain-containing protein [Candidatus Neomarinimicrobiota bacterium]